VAECRDRIATQLAFYANGTLPEALRAEVEAHVTVCEECHRLLAVAHLSREQMGSIDSDAHVQAQLLAEFADGTGEIAEEARARVASHLEECDVCAGAVKTLREISKGASEQGRRAVSRDPMKAGAGSASWLRTLLASTILQPVPALSYLVVAAAGLTWIAFHQGPRLIPTEPADLLPAPIAVNEDVSLRGEGAGAPPLQVPSLPGAVVRLELHTDLDREERAPGAPMLLLMLRHGEEILWSSPVAPESIPPDGTLEVILRPDELPREVALELTLTVDGGLAPLFSRSIMLVETE
jgi:hypothetical protein